MVRSRTDPDLALLDLEAWEAPSSLSEEDLYAHSGADRRSGGRASDDLEDDR